MTDAEKIEKVIRVGINKHEGDLTITDFAKVKELDLNCSKISNLNLLIRLINLKYLDLDENKVSDLQPLSALTHLESLVIHRNQITDLTPPTAFTSEPVRRRVAGMKQVLLMIAVVMCCLSG